MPRGPVAASVTTGWAGGVVGLLDPCSGMEVGDRSAGLLVGPAGVINLGVPEAGGDGLGRLTVGTGHLGGTGELLDSGQVGGYEDFGKPRDKVILSRV